MRFSSPLETPPPHRNARAKQCTVVVLAVGVCVCASEDIPPSCGEIFVRTTAFCYHRFSRAPEWELKLFCSVYYRNWMFLFAPRRSVELSTAAGVQFNNRSWDAGWELEKERVCVFVCVGKATDGDDRFVAGCWLSTTKSRPPMGSTTSTTTSTTTTARSSTAIHRRASHFRWVPFALLFDRRSVDSADADAVAVVGGGTFCTRRIFRIMLPPRLLLA